jgi:hypothetical protein
MIDSVEDFYTLRRLLSQVYNCDYKPSRAYARLMGYSSGSHAAILGKMVRYTSSLSPSHGSFSAARALARIQSVLFYTDPHPVTAA